MKGGFYEEQIPACESPLCVGRYLSFLSDSKVKDSDGPMKTRITTRGWDTLRILFRYSCMNPGYYMYILYVFFCITDSFCIADKIKFIELIIFCQ